MLRAIHGRMERATGVQRLGFLLALVEAGLLGVLALMHFGLDWTIGGVELAASFVVPAAIIELVLALGLLLAVIMPGDGAVRAGRVIAAQILVLIGVFVEQVVFAAADWRGALYIGAILALALASLASIASPAYRRHAVARKI